MKANTIATAPVVTWKGSGMRALSMDGLRRAVRGSTASSAAWMLASIALAMLLAISGRKLSRDINALQVMEMRSVIAWFMLLPFVYAEGGIGAMRTGALRRHVGRNAAHYVGQLAWLLGLALIPLAEVVAIEFTAPIWAALMAAVFLREPLTWRKAVAILAGLVGVVLIVHPRTAALNLGHVLVMAAAFLFAISFIVTKSLTRHDRTTTIIFWMLIIQSVIGLVPATVVWTWPPANLWIWILLVAFSGTFTHFCVAQALRGAEVMVIMPIDYLTVPVSAILGYLLYGEASGTQTIIGAALIVVGNLVNLKRSNSARS